MNNPVTIVPAPVAQAPLPKPRTQRGAFDYLMPSIRALKPGECVKLPPDVQATTVYSTATRHGLKIRGRMKEDGFYVSLVQPPAPLVLAMPAGAEQPELPPMQPSRSHGCVIPPPEQIPVMEAVQINSGIELPGKSPLAGISQPAIYEAMGKMAVGESFDVPVQIQPHIFSTYGKKLNVTMVTRTLEGGTLRRVWRKA